MTAALSKARACIYVGGRVGSGGGFDLTRQGLGLGFIGTFILTSLEVNLKRYGGAFLHVSEERERAHVQKRFGRTFLARASGDAAVAVFAVDRRQRLLRARPRPIIDPLHSGTVRA